MKKTIVILLCLMMVLPLASSGRKENEKVLTVYAYDSFAGDWGPAGKLIPEFESKTGIKVRMVSAGDAVEVLSRVILEGDKTDADVILGVSDDFAYLAYPYLESYSSPFLENVSDDLRFDKEDRLLPFDYGAFSFVWDSESGIREPESLEDLAGDEYKDKIILIDPRTSSVGLGLLYWSYNVMGDECLPWWKAVTENALTTTSGWSSAYGLFTEGEAPIVLSYTTSPVYHVMNEDTTRYRAIIFDEGHEATIEGIGIVKGTKMRKEAEAFVDFILTDGQLDIAIANSMYPVSDAVELPDAFDYAPKPGKMFTSGSIDDSVKDSLLDRWVDAVTGK